MIQNCYEDDSIQTLGKTGQTVVYIFPCGNALVNRNQAEDTQASTATQYADHNEHAPLQVEEYILQAGLITPGQYSVARYDQAATGLSLVEVLQLRGWITDLDLATLTAPQELTQ